MNDFISENLKKLKDNKIPNPEIDLRVLLNNSRCCENEIIFSNFNINQIDINGKKQGDWIKYDDNGKLRYKGQFIDDIPSGVFKYYYDTGELKLEKEYFHKGSAAATHIFYKNGDIKASGTLTIQEQGKVSGKIEYQNLQIKLGGQISGDIKLSDKIQSIKKDTKPSDENNISLQESMKKE